MTLPSMPDRQAYLDPLPPVEQRVEDLVAQMTSEERILEMAHTPPAIERLGVPE